MRNKYIKNNFLSIKKLLLDLHGAIRYIQMPNFFGNKYYKINPPKYNKNEIALYIHVPFCFQKCNYCNYHGNNSIYRFGSKRYTSLLIKELHIFLKQNDYKKYTLSSLLMGGGTPTLLEGKDIYRFMVEIKKYFILNKNSQLTIETVPNTISIEKANFIQKAGFNRISMGVQSFNEKILKKVGRKQKNINIYQAFKNFRKVGLDYISIDLILGLDKKETEKDFIDITKKHINKLKPSEIYFFTLQEHGNDKNFNTEYCLKSLYYKGLKYNKSKYVYDRIVILKNILGLGNGAQGQFFQKNGSLNILGGKYKNINIYEKIINKGYTFYKVNTLGSCPVKS